MSKLDLTDSARQSQERLIEGNKRFAGNKMSHPTQTEKRRAQLATEGQEPFAIILGCADSRIPPEIIFDQGLGDLFVIRVAGNVVDDLVLASIEYAAAHLGTPLIVVLGHSKCGAVAASIAGGQADGHLGGLVELIQPAIAKSNSGNCTCCCEGDQARRVEMANVWLMKEQLRQAAPILANLVTERKLSVVGAHYDQSTGLVEWLEC